MRVLGYRSVAHCVVVLGGAEGPRRCWCLYRRPTTSQAHCHHNHETSNCEWRWLSLSCESSSSKFPSLLSSIATTSTRPPSVSESKWRSIQKTIPSSEPPFIICHFPFVLFEMCCFHIWTWPVRGPGVRACPDGLEHFFVHVQMGNFLF